MEISQAERNQRLRDELMLPTIHTSSSASLVWLADGRVVVVRHDGLPP